MTHGLEELVPEYRKDMDAGIPPGCRELGGPQEVCTITTPRHIVETMSEVDGRRKVLLPQMLMCLSFTARG